jgi:hypothetical protein
MRDSPCAAGVDVKNASVAACLYCALFGANFMQMEGGWKWLQRQWLRDIFSDGVLTAR